MQTALELYTWLQQEHPSEWKKLSRKIKFSDKELEKWQHVVEHMYVPFDPQTRLVEQFEGYFQRRDVNLAALEPRTESVQALLGIEGANATQVIKQPDVLMLMYLLPDLYDHETLLANYAYYNARTDHTFGSSLGPSIQSIMARKADDPGAYEHFLRAARADLFNVRNNAGDGIHGASAGGLWQAVIFGFAGLHHTTEGWKAEPRFPDDWRRVAFKIVDHGQELTFDLRKDAS
jgi:kojibiose phosphorylase